jgi:malate dehydrogenase (oxaloacetate-decarboxylating)
MNFNEKSLELHLKYRGKLGTESLVKIDSLDDLSVAYTPGVAEPCLRIKDDPSSVYDYTFKGRTIAVISNGTAVLGLGNIGPAAGLPVMEGKCVLFKTFAGIDAFPLVINAKTVDEVVDFCKAVAPTFGGINLEDIRSPECFEIEERLKKELDIPVFHDDQHGTAVVVTSGLINALRLVNKSFETIKVVLNGPGAAGNAIIKMLQHAGVKDIIAVDEFGTIYDGCQRKENHKMVLSHTTNPRQIQGGLSEAVKGADVFIGVSVPNCLTQEMAESMADDAIVFAMANPTPEIMPDVAKRAGVRVIATGRSDFPNQINNVLGFPGIFKGALDVRASDINEEMNLAASYAIASLVDKDELREDYIIPSCLDKRVVEAVSKAVREAAVKTGVNRI